MKEAFILEIPGEDNEGNPVLRNVFYTPVSPPCGDSDELAAQGERLMFYHGDLPVPSRLFVAPMGEIRSGWVLGKIRD